MFNVDINFGLYLLYSNIPVQSPSISIAHLATRGAEYSGIITFHYTALHSTLLVASNALLMHVDTHAGGPRSAF